MIAALSLAVQAAPSASAPALAPIGRQQLPPRGCAAFLWPLGAGDRATAPVAMASADPALLRIALDGAPIDLAPIARRGEGGLGLAASTDYRGGDVAATLDLGIVPRSDLRDGAAVPQATLRVRRDGHDERVVPLAGLIGCRPGG